MNGSQKALRNPAPPKTQVRIRSFFNSRKLEKLVPSLNFGTTTPSNYVFSRKVQRESSIVPSPPLQISLHPRRNLPRLPFFFFFFRFQRLFRRMDSRFETRSIFNRLNFTWTPSVSLKEEDANDFVPSSRMDGRNFEGEATMMQVSDVFQWWALPVGMVGEVILSFASRFSFLFARKAKKWTKIYRYQVSFYYL